MEQCCNRTVQIGKRCDGCPHDIPQWAIDRAIELAGKRREPWTIPTEDTTRTTQAFARYIAQHEQPPVDPDVIAVREILAAFADVQGAGNGPAIRSGEWDDSPDLQIPLCVYRKHKEAGK